MADEIGIQILMRLRQIIRELSKHSKHIQENFKITVPQLLCLQEVYDHGPISIGALTKIVFLNNSTVTGIVDRLEKRDLVKRARISKDRRQVHVEITDKGTHFIQNAPEPLQKRFIERLQKLDKEKVTLILWVLEILVDLLGPDKSMTEVPTPPAHVTQEAPAILTESEI
ncbi:MAG: MarR family transcriptional regulator [Deltaproteobacteria bacterium]|nr:MarR family transcriptional regulator [Deltaproteobacteria bacterium]